MSKKIGISTSKGFLNTDGTSLELVNDNGVLKLGNTIIPQKKLLFSGRVSNKSGATTMTTIYTDEKSLIDRTIEIKGYMCISAADLSTEDAPQCVSEHQIRIKIKNFGGSAYSSVGEEYRYICSTYAKCNPVEFIKFVIDNNTIKMGVYTVGGSEEITNQNEFNVTEIYEIFE